MSDTVSTWATTHLLGRAWDSPTEVHALSGTTERLLTRAAPNVEPHRLARDLHILANAATDPGYIPRPLTHIALTIETFGTHVEIDDRDLTPAEAVTDDGEPLEYMTTYIHAPHARTLDAYYRVRRSPADPGHTHVYANRQIPIDFSAPGVRASVPAALWTTAIDLTHLATHQPKFRTGIIPA